MPGPLKDVEQKVGLNAQAYHQESWKVVADNVAMGDSFRDVAEQAARLENALGTLGTRSREVFAGASDALGKVNEIGTALGALADREVTIRVRYVTEGDAGSAGIAASLGGAGSTETLQVLRNTSASVDQVSASLGRMEEHLASIKRDTADSSADLMQQTEMLRSNAGAQDIVTEALTRRGAAARDAAAAVRDAALADALSGTQPANAGMWSTTTSDATAALIARNIVRSGGTTSNTGDPAVAAALGALLGGGGSVVGGASGGGGGGGGGLLTAGGYADKITGTVGRVLPAIHYITMAVAELAATVVPAAVALGSAGFVGLQGGQQMYTRISAINDVMQSLGGAYGGGTTGSFLGLQPKLQQLQNYAQGGTYEIAGAGINLVKSGVGSAFGQQGVQTIAMIDRGIADMQNNLAARGGGQQLGALFGGGTGYLRQFGDIGSNLGNIILGMAPHLPGVGEDWLAGLEGVTGGVAGGIGLLNKTHLGNVLGGGMAAEAGWRLGTPLLGLAGKGLGGLGGLAARLGMGSVAEGTGVAGALGGAGDVLGALTGPEVAGLALSAFLGSKLISSMPTPAQRQVSALQSRVDTSGFTAAWQPLGSAITETTGLAAQAQTGTYLQELSAQGAKTGYELGRYGPSAGGQTVTQTFQAAAAGFTQQMDDLTRSGPQLVTALDKAGLKGTSMADAFQIAQNSLLDLSHAFGKNGELNKQAMTMVGNYVAANVPMTQNAGALGAAIGAQTIMSQGSVKQLQQVNQSMDSMTSIMTGGAAGMATLFGMLGGAPVTKGATRAGIQLSAPPAYSQMARALTSFTSAGGASAWNTFAGSQGYIASEEQNLDQIRTALTLTQGLSSPFTVQQGMGLAGFQLEQLLPMAKQSPAALAMIMQQASQMGIGASGPNGGYYDSSKSLAQNYQDAEKAIGGIADSTKQANSATNDMTVKLSQIPAIAKQFSTTVGTTLQSQEAANAATSLLGIQKSALGGGVNKAAIQDWVDSAKAAGIEGGKALTSTINAQLGSMGVSHAMQLKIDAVVAPPKLPAMPKPPPIEYPARTATPVPHPPPQGGTVNYPSHVQTPVAPPAPRGGTVVYNSIVAAPGGALSPGGGVAGMATVSGSAVRLLGQSGFRVPGTGSGDTVPAMLEPGELVVPRGMVAAGAVDHLRGSIPGFQSGGIIGVPSYPGLGVSFRVAMEQVAQELLTDMQQALGSVAGGSSRLGMMQPYGGGPGTTAGVPHGTLANPVAVHVASVAPPAVAALGGSSMFPGAAGPMPKAANKVIDAFEETFKNMPGPWNRLASQILTGLLDGVKNSTKETAAMAQALVSKVTTEINYGRSVANTAVAGLNFPGMQVATPTMTAQGQPYQYYTDQANIAAGGQPGSVQEQMSSYLQAEKSFQGDMSKLAKGGLEKRLLSQLYSAGPVQGDAEAQSIMGGQGGIKAANQLYNQINSLATKIGVGAIGNVYGQPATSGLHGKDVKVPVHADTAAAQAQINQIHGKTVVLKVKVEIEGGGSGGGLTADGLLPKSVLNGITAQVQAALLKQAKINRRTGLQLQGYGA